MTAVLFDLDGTLNDRNRALDRFAGRFVAHFVGCRTPADGSGVASALRRVDGDGYVPRERVCAQLIDALDWDERPAVETLLGFWFSTFPLCAVAFDGAADTLAAMRRLGWRLGLISNGRGRVQRAKLATMGLAGAFDDLVISGEVGLRKPDPAIFSVALDRLNVTSSDAWFVGDHAVNDVAAAGVAGLRAVWFAGRRTWPDGSPPPPRSVRRLEELIPLIMSETGG